MPAVESQMLELGTMAPDFTLPDPDGNLHALASAREAAQAEIVAIHVNHGLHPDAPEWEKHCRTFADKLGKDFWQLYDATEQQAAERKPGIPAGP